MPMRKLFWAALTVIGAGVLQWMLVPAPVLPPPGRVADAAWQLPAAQKPQPQEALEVLQNAGLWGKVTETEAQKPLTDPPWRLVGVITGGPERYVLIMIEGQPQQQLKVGDSVPGGSRILSIEDASLCLLVNGKKRKLDIYPQGSLVL